MHGTVSGLPVERYIGIDPERRLPLMITRDGMGRHWVTDGTRSAVIYPDERDTDSPHGEAYAFDYSVQRSASLLASVEPVIRDALPYDALIYANWLVLATHDLMLEYPRGTTAVERVALDRDSPEARHQVLLKIQGADKSFRVRRFLPKRQGHFDLTVAVQADASVLLSGWHSLLDVELREEIEVRPGEATEQAREIVDQVLEFVWLCRSFE